MKRSIALLPTSPERLESAATKLRSIESVSDVRIDGATRLRIRYDAGCVGFADIERLLDEAGLQRPANTWWRFRSALYRFLDGNARSNALSSSNACCNRPPSGWRPGRDSDREH